MKRLLLISYLCCIYGNMNIIASDNRVDTSLPKQMYKFFTETLHTNYKIEDEAKLYETFLNDYFEYYQHITINKKIGFLDSIDVKKLREINQLLFIRDRQHYYRFYSEVIERKGKKLDFKPSDSPTVGVDTAIMFGPTITKQDMVFDSFFESHNVVMSQAFADSLDSRDSKTASYLKKRLNHDLYFSFINFAQFFVVSDAKSELNEKQVRLLVAIIFWKLLCLQAGQDFHQKVSL